MSSAPRPGNTSPLDGDNRDAAIEERIEVAARLNAQLYGDLERYIALLDRTEQERDAWAAHARGLAQKLVQARKQCARLGQLLAATGHAPPPSADADEANAEEDARQLAELLQQQHTAAGTALEGAGADGAPARTQQQQQRAQGAALYPASVLSATAETRTALAAQPLPQPSDAAEQEKPPPVPINPTPNQQRVLESLVQRGRAMGWLIQQSEVTIGRVLGEGEFGTTYLGSWRHAAVAVKIVRLNHAAELTSFLREVESMSYIRHPNVVPFLGACLATPNQLSLVSEFMTGGTLADWIHPNGMPAPGTQSSGTSKPLLERLTMAHQVALGMCALEACRPAVLHRDLKPANVYLDTRGVARIGDFGLSRRLLDEARSSLTGETGTYLYMAPEVMRHEVYDIKADVWSWGVVAMAVAEEQLSPVVPGSIHEEVQLVLRLACQFDPEMRPDFASLADMLGSAIRHMEEQQAPRPTLLGSIQSSLLGGWSFAWGSGTNYPGRTQRKEHVHKRQGQARLPGSAQLQRQQLL
ncbi:hypothetical protein GPECTOR_2g1098 [Gonium pectorale]|uniref:Protein kinase domain-containing protein n=1 Tax=Gonium pectorale TaxID=33097 RepID=A0A150H0A3_GONPE|nr:hypothetical protein GPECTOR_2g1098 [Gonium pectorale]|eukprot:KXZ55549.1 hypothetical protein GPECTOR_2g1098 [Gonium pectorale]